MTTYHVTFINFKGCRETIAVKAASASDAEDVIIYTFSPRIIISVKDSKVVAKRPQKRKHSPIRQFTGWVFNLLTGENCPPSSQTGAMK